MSEKYLFQYCQKLVVFSKDSNSVLLCKRKGEADYDGTFSFIGGKMETTDESIIDGLKREKDEEVGKECVITLYPNFSMNLLYTKADGHKMILPHYLGVFEEGEIDLNDEYSEYAWVPLAELDAFEPKVPNIPEVVQQLRILKEKHDVLTSVSI